MYADAPFKIKKKFKNSKKKITKYCRTYGGASCCHSLSGQLGTAVPGHSSPVKGALQQSGGQSLGLNLRDFVLSPLGTAPAPHTGPAVPHTLKGQSLVHLFCCSLPNLQQVLKLCCVNTNTEPSTHSRCSLCMTEHEKRGFSISPGVPPAQHS